MKKRALRQSIIREIFQSKARFLSILLIILLGVAFYAGIKATGPDMIRTADTYYQKQKLMNTTVTAPFGLEEADLELIKASDKVQQAAGAYRLDTVNEKENQVIRLLSYDLNQVNQLNKPRVVSGRLPKKANEVVLDNRAAEFRQVKIGDTFKIDDDETKKELTVTDYQVVGFVNSPLYIDQVSRGNTTVGKGSIDYFALVPKENFKATTYSDIYVTYKNLVTVESYSELYNKRYQKNEKSLKELLSTRSDERKAAKIKAVESDLATGTQQITDGKQQIKIGRQQLAQQSDSLENQRKQIEQAKVLGQDNRLAEQQLEQAKKILSDKEKELDEAATNLTKQEIELQSQKQAAAQLKQADYRYTGRDDNAAYSEYEDNADRISSIATVFPVFFLLIAALICLTTMTRMVDEKRGEIGTLKALGYTNWEIAQKYIVYATLASLIGSLAGLAIGYYVFPMVIFNAYGSLYNLPAVIITFYTSYAIQSLIVALLCTLISALIVLRVDLISTPAVLMRPKAPKPGQRILLERIPWVWQRLNFNQKVTARNLFRYKQRMLMTILGIAGCMTMIITGFGIKDSVGDIVGIQFSKIWHYDATVIYNNDTSENDNKDYEQVRDDLPEYSQHLLLAQKTVEVKKKGYKTHEVTLDVPKNTDKLAQFITFQQRQTQEKYQLTDDGVIINEKLANLFDIKTGDDITIDLGDNATYEVRVAHIVENYTLHFIYMTPNYYDTLFGHQPTYNVELLKFKHALSEKREEQLAKELMDSPKVINVSFTSQIGKAMEDTMSSLTIVVWVLIVSAALLAFIVLYNLTNINISERIRELSTIKVLGFYDREVTLYVYRENNILTAIGILLGCLLGKLLHGFVLKTAEVDIMMFPPTIHWVSYVYSALLTIFFSLVVMLIMHRKLKKVDMIEALKSTD